MAQIANTGASDFAIGWWCRNQDLRVASVRIRAALVMRALAAGGTRARWFDPERPEPFHCLVLSKRYDDATVDVARAFKARGGRVVLDLCDNHFIPASDQAKHQAQVSNLRLLAAMSDAITTSAAPLADIVGRECVDAPTPRVIGDLADDLSIVTLPWYRRPGVAWKRRREQAYFDAMPRSTVRLVWFGNSEGRQQQSGLVDLERITPDLCVLHRKYPLHLTIISNSETRYRAAFERVEFPHHYVEWNPWTFDAVLSQQQIAMIPAAQNEFTACKSDNRAVSAFRAGLAVLADPIPSYVHYGDAIGFGAVSETLPRYLDDPTLCRSNIKRGRELALERSDPEQIARQWREVCAPSP